MKRPGGFDTGAGDEEPRDTRAARGRDASGYRDAPEPRDASGHRDASGNRDGGVAESEALADHAGIAKRPGVLDRLGKRRAAGATGADPVVSEGVPAAQGFFSSHGPTASNDPSASQDFSATQDLSATQEVSGSQGAAGVQGRAGVQGHAGTAGGQASVGGALERAAKGGALLARRTPRSADPVRAAEKRLRAAERQNKKRLKRETRRFTAASRRRRRRAFIALGTVGGLVVFVLAGAFTPIMSVREVRVEGASHVNVEDVQLALSEFEGVPLALVDESAVLRALEGFPLIQRFAVERLPPKTLVVRIEERVPAIAIEQDGVFRMYDAAGVLVGEAPERPEGVPLGGGGLKNTSSKGFLAASKIVRDMPAGLRAQLVAVDATSSQDVTFQLASGVEVFWGNTEETKRKSLVVETMLASLQDRPVSHLDVSSTESPIFR